MATLETRLRDLATAIGTALKATRTLVNGNAADLAALNTAAKSNLVAALNELKAGLDAIDLLDLINDASASSTTQTYSIDKIRDLVTTSIDAVIAGAPAAINTLDELAAAIGDDANFAATITAALGNRVRVDTNAQGLTAPQKSNARTNIGADVTSTETGTLDTDFAGVFNAALT